MVSLVSFPCYPNSIPFKSRWSNFHSFIHSFFSVFQNEKKKSFSLWKFTIHSFNGLGPYVVVCVFHCLILVCWFFFFIILDHSLFYFLSSFTDDDDDLDHMHGFFSLFYFEYLMFCVCVCVSIFQIKTRSKIWFSIRVCLCVILIIFR